MLTLDTSGLLALLNTGDTHHRACLDAFIADGGPYFLSVAILSEIAWFLETRFAGNAQWAVMNDLRNGVYRLDWSPRDIERIHTLAQRYDDLPLGLSDAAVIACAERHNGRILTTDYRHFSVVARREGTISVLPTL